MTTRCGSVSGCDSSRMEGQGLKLMSLLMACLESVVSKNIPVTTTSNQSSASLHCRTILRSTNCFLTIQKELVIRITHLWSNFFCVYPPARVLEAGKDEGATTVRPLNHISPVPKFLQFDMNEMILKSLEGKEKLHVIDLYVKDDLQRPYLF